MIASTKKNFSGRRHYENGQHRSKKGESKVIGRRIQRAQLKRSLLKPI